MIMKRFCLFIGLLMSLATWAASQADMQKDAYWQDFRNSLPNPYRTIAYATFDDHSQLYIISEPPLGVTLEQIENAFGGFLYDIETRKWNYGVDGWVKDVLVTIEFAPDSCEQELIPELNRVLFGYEDQALFHKLPLERKRTLFLPDSLNMSINAASLYGWFIEDDMPMEDFDGIPYTFREICCQAQSGVYRSVEPGFIVWTLPKNGKIGMKDKHFRKFTLNSDMIIGGISSWNTLCIIGRQREQEFLDLPPLRSDEVAMLAWAPQRLSQSLDIDGLVTGKMSDNYDWCPAYLSDELNNTEVGHLMTLTDIFMKDWLSGGTYAYDQYRYPKPVVDFEGDLNSYLSVRYNWNVKGLYSTFDYYPYTVFSIRNTGILNCSLFDSHEINETSIVDKAANDYLASLNNVDLFRVAQYFALFEMFKEFGIKCPSYKQPPFMPKSELLVADARNLLNRIRQMSETEKNAIIQKAAEEQFIRDGLSGFNYAFEQTKQQERQQWEQRFDQQAEKNAAAKHKRIEKYKQTKEYKRAKENFEMAFNDYITHMYENAYKSEVSRQKADVSMSMNSLLLAANAIPKSDIDGFCRYSSCAHDMRLTVDEYSRYQKYKHNLKYGGGVWLYGKYLGFDLKDVKERYQRKVLNDTTYWHKSPKVVISNNHVGMRKGADGQYKVGAITGGHSITPEVEKKKPEPEQKRQEKKEVSTYYVPKNNSPTTTLSEIERESRKGADLVRQGKRYEGYAHAAYARQLMTKEIKPEPVNTNDELYQTLMREAKKAQRAQDEREREAKRKEKIREQERRTIQIYREKEQVTREYDDAIRALSQTRADREANDHLIQKLERERQRIANIQPPTQEELERNRPRQEQAPTINPRNAAPQEEEEEDDYWDQYIKSLERQVRSSRQTLSRLEETYNQQQQQSY